MFWFVDENFGGSRLVENMFSLNKILQLSLTKMLYISIDDLGKLMKTSVSAFVWLPLC